MQNNFFIFFKFYDILIVWRHGQVVRQEPAKLLPPVRIWVPPILKTAFCGCFFYIILFKITLQITSTLFLKISMDNKRADLLGQPLSPIYPYNFPPVLILNTLPSHDTHIEIVFYRFHFSNKMRHSNNFRMCATSGNNNF